MKKILLVRHVQTQGNLALRYVGKLNSPISEYGKKQFKYLENYFKNIKLDKVYSSPSERAMLTAKSFSEEIILDERFREIDFGIFEGLTHAEIEKRYPEEVNKQNLERDGFKFPEGDSLTSFYERTSKALDNVINETKDGETVAIVSHGGVVRIMLSHLISKSKDQFWRFCIDNASITTICVEDGYAVIHGVNEKILEVE